MGKKNNSAPIFSFIFGILGTVPLYLIIFIFNLRLYFLCAFIGFGFYLGYYLMKREELETGKEIMLIVCASVITMLTAVCAECVFSYQTYMMQCQNLGMNPTYAELMQDIPLSHLLGYYIGLDLLEIGDETIVFNSVVAAWMNVVQSLIFSLIGTQIIKIYLFFEKKSQKKPVLTKKTNIK